MDLTRFSNDNPYQRDEWMRGREGGRAKERIGRKTQFILSNWLHLSKHSLLAQWSFQTKSMPAAKTKNIPACVQLHRLKGNELGFFFF